jgi:prepilin-type processing-associated H-X9-DG protein
MTIVEVLVTIGILGLLMALLLPAVQAARSTSQRLRCASNQRQLMLAVTNYHDNFRLYPPLSGSLGANRCSSATAIGRLFPYLELQDVCDLLDADVNRLPILECPADPDISLLSTPLSYVFNDSPGIGSGSTFQGPFPSVGTARAADVTDGLSNTAALSENFAVRSGGTSAEAARRPPHFRWSVFVPAVSDEVPSAPLSPASLAERAAQTDLSIQDCRQGPRTFVPATTPDGPQWGPGGFGAGSWTYSHWFPPNSPSCGVQTAGIDPNLFLLNNRRSASAHTGGVNVVFLDGHQRFVSDQIDQAVWRAAGTRDGSELNGDLP